MNTDWNFILRGISSLVIQAIHFICKIGQLINISTAFIFLSNAPISSMAYYIRNLTKYNLRIRRLKYILRFWIHSKWVNLKNLVYFQSGSSLVLVETFGCLQLNRSLYLRFTYDKLIFLLLFSDPPSYLLII